MSESKPAATIEIIYNPGTECYEAIQTTGTTKNILMKFNIQDITNILTNHIVLYLEAMARREQDNVTRQLPSAFINAYLEQENKDESQND